MASAGLWSKIKHYGSNTITAFGDVDGDTEEETHVHKVLAAYYLDQHGALPPFLGGPTGAAPRPHSAHAPTTASSAARPRPTASAPPAVEPPAENRAGRPSLKDIYQKSSRSATAVRPTGGRPPPMQASAPDLLGPTYGQDSESRVREKLRRRPASPGQVPDDPRMNRYGRY
ncbi:uncharacterized protein V1510DRAFT_432512 [Dipodascopsis tothii]|uniref:uncharacterized protein n=1 Tax=Dipodascopsis tothii TaxID=44089 RepID=UPI0034CE181C